MPISKATRPFPAPVAPRDAHPLSRRLSPESRRLARTAGAALALAALVSAFAASAQTAVYGPRTESNGVLPWIFALFVAAAVLGVFLVVLTLGRRPTGREQQEHPGSRNR